MSRVILLGVGPLPAPNLERVHAPGLRLRAYLDAIKCDGNKILVGELVFAGANIPHQQIFENNLYAHRRLDSNPGKALHTLNTWIRDFDPEAVVALTDVAANLVAMSEWDGPLYVDYNGHPMTERQQLCAIHGNNQSLAAQWEMVLPVLLRADRFSVCSGSQRLALIGELGAAGRLNAETSGHDLIDVIPPSVPFRSAPVMKQRQILSFYNVPSDVKIIFNSGGYNTWLDEETLFKGLSLAMQKDESIHYVSTGGAIDGHVAIVYNKFRERIERSSLASRFHLLGWVPHDDLFDLMQVAHVGVNVDLPSLEGELGFRNRLLGWLWAGQRIVSTVTSDGTAELVRQGMVRAVPTSDPEALAEALQEELAKGRYRDLEKLHKWLMTNWSGDIQLSKLREWTLKPMKAPDRLKGGVVDNPLTQWQRKVLESASRVHSEQSIRQQAREAAQTLLGSRLIRTMGSMHPQAMAILKKLADL